MCTLNDVENILVEAVGSITAPHDGITANTSKAYYENLCDLDADLLRASVRYCIQNNSAFFPSVYDIRESAKKLIELSLGIPSAGEAWAMLQDAKKRKPAEYCDTGAKLRDSLYSLSGSDYLKTVMDLKNHESGCDVCHGAYDYLSFDHPAVQNTVKSLGGVEFIITGNPTADRARWFEAYNAIVKREIEKATLHPVLRSEIVNIKNRLLADLNIKQLAEKLSK